MTSNSGASLRETGFRADASSQQVVSTEGFNPARWLDPSTAPRTGEIIGWWGQTIPDHHDVRAATFLSPDDALEMGYREFSRFGGWLIWNSDCDWYVVDENALWGWLPMPGNSPALSSDIQEQSA